MLAQVNGRLSDENEEIVTTGKVRVGRLAMHIELEHADSHEDSMCREERMSRSCNPVERHQSVSASARRCRHLLESQMTVTGSRLQQACCITHNAGSSRDNLENVAVYSVCIGESISTLTKLTPRPGLA